MKPIDRSAIEEAAKLPQNEEDPQFHLAFEQFATTLDNLNSQNLQSFIDIGYQCYDYNSTAFCDLFQQNDLCQSYSWNSSNTKINCISKSFDV